MVIVKQFMKKHRKVLIAGCAMVLVAAVGVTGFLVTRPGPVGLTGEAAVVAEAAAADDWAALPRDDEGNPIGVPEATLDKKGDAIIPPGQASEKRSADEPLPVVLIKSDTTLLDTTADTAATLSMILQDQNANVALSEDDCLLDWAKSTLPTVSGTVYSGAMEVCGRPAAVMYGGYSTSTFDLNLHAQYAPVEKERTALSEILYKNDRLGYASVATDDGQGVLLVVAPVTGDAATAETVEPIGRIEPVVPPKPKVLQDR